jgi:hypothetical protein
MESNDEILSSCGFWIITNYRSNRGKLLVFSKSYKDRKFPEAEQLFRDAVSRDPKGETVEGKTAQLFLARTLHSEFIGDRKNTAKAEEAIAEYQKALALNPNDQSSYKAIASLYENLQKNDEWLDWVTKRSTNTSIPQEQRAEALTSLAAKKNSCANDITDTEATKKTVTKDGKQTFQFVKPENETDFATLKQCVQEGLALTEQTAALETEQVKNAKSLNIKSLTDEQLKSNQDLLKVFESARSYRASLLVQAMRLAEMEGRTEDRDRLKTESEAARQSFLDLSEVVKSIQNEIDERVAAREAEAAREAPNKNSAANAK